MDTSIALAAGLGGACFGAAAGRWQHLLYRQPAYRQDAARGLRRFATMLLVAVACGVVVALALRPGLYAVGPALLTAAFGAALVVLSSTDFERRIIPNRVVYPAIVAAGALCWAWPDRSVASCWLGFAVAGGVALGFFLVGRLLGGALGMGDVKLTALIGLLLGWPGAMYALFLGALLAGIPSLAMTVSGRGGRFFSYGPYLALGALVVLLWPDPFL